MWLFAGLSIIVLPLIILYATKDGYKKSDPGIFKKTMLGNIPEVKTKCQFYNI